jgi:4,5-dihydroxyphthalate decarboxylase
VDIPITIACGNYDRTQAIKDGVVKVEGCAVTYLPLYPEEIFHRAFKFQEFDVSELSFSSYLRTVAAGTSAYIGIPAFVSRIFRHSGIYIRSDAGIRTPHDLRGKRIGLPEYQITAVVWMRGLMQHEYGVHPSEIHWRSGGQEQPGRHERTPLKPIPGRPLRSSPASRTSRGCFPTRAQPRWPITRRLASFPSCTSSASASRWSSAIPGFRPASTRPSAPPRRSR